MKSEELLIRPIAHIHCDFKEKFGIPRQSGLIDSAHAKIVFLPEYRNPDALRGLDGYTHLWLLWQFSEAVRSEWSPTVRPPRLGGNKRMGVFASRSPFRPNPIGLSSVKIVSIDLNTSKGPIIEVAGASTFSEFPVKAIHSRDKIVQAMKNLEPETSDKIKMVISELIKIVARKSFRIPENEITTRINEGLAKWGETTSQFTEKVSATKGKIADKVNETTDRITERVNLTTEKLTEKVTEATDIIAETKDRITDRLNETTGRLTDTIEKARNLLKREEDGKAAPDTETTDKTDET